MNWDDCVELVRLSNQSDPGFFDFVLAHLDDIDGQSLHMIINGVTLTPDNVREHLDFFERLTTHLDTTTFPIDFRTCFRLNFLNSLLVDARKVLVEPPK
jgi:hypothetical protein